MGKSNFILQYAILKPTILRKHCSFDHSQSQLLAPQSHKHLSSLSVAREQDIQELCIPCNKQSFSEIGNQKLLLNVSVHNIKSIRSICLQCSCNCSTNMGSIRANTSGKSEISNLWSELFIEENIAGFYVSVDNLCLGTSMKVCKPLSRSTDDCKSLLPAQNMACVFRCINIMNLGCCLE